MYSEGWLRVEGIWWAGWKSTLRHWFCEKKRRGNRWPRSRDEHSIAPSRTVLFTSTNATMLETCEAVSVSPARASSWGSTGQQGERPCTIKTGQIKTRSKKLFWRWNWINHKTVQEISRGADFPWYQTRNVIVIVIYNILLLWRL